MDKAQILNDKTLFCAALHEKMNYIAPVCQRMEPYEFRYSLNNITPHDGAWSGIALDSVEEIAGYILSPQYFEQIQIKPKVEGQIVLDKEVTRLTQMLFVGLVMDKYSAEWVKRNFYFDPRGFNFYIRSIYETEEIHQHLGGTPYLSFEAKQKAFEFAHEIGYQEFIKANNEVDEAFIQAILKLVATKGTPILLGIAGPTAAGKTEIVDRLRTAFEAKQKKIATIELDNFMLDRDFREEQGIGSFGTRALHFELLKSCIQDILQGKTIFTPRYDFIEATSSHDLQSSLKPGGIPVQIDPADIIFIEGNSPFILPGIKEYVGIKVVYLTDDPVRLLRKWRRDIDYRKKYDPYYLRNRFFKEQPPMAWKNYQPQLLICDIYVNTTSAQLWVTTEIKEVLSN